MRIEDRQRITYLLEQDREELNTESRAAAERDFLRVAGEYFETEGKLSLAVAKEKRGFSVTVTFRAGRVKNFTPLR